MDRNPLAKTQFIIISTHDYLNPVPESSTDRDETHMDIGYTLMTEQSGPIDVANPASFSPRSQTI
ncbi:MAG: hypothetical protein JO272_16340 [Pseudonocardiales bacterium]|nr:hypothetical protein [Pseudonocardiales bacterium]